MYSDKLTVCIVGNGFVGNAIYQNVRDEVETKAVSYTHLTLPTS